MKIELTPIETIFPYPQNSRIHSDAQVALIARSIEDYSFTQPVVIDESNIVLVGHGRLLAAQKLGLQQVPTLQLKNLTEAQKRAYRILDNKLQNDSEWDFGNLELEIEALQEADFPIEDWGLESLFNLDTIPSEIDESIADGIELLAKFKIQIPIPDSSNFESQLDEILKKFPTAKKEKTI